MTAEKQCSKCGGAMTRGFVLDLGDYQVKQQQVWVEGDPVPSFWSGLKTSDKNAYHVQAFRCQGCGYLEFYTTEHVTT